MRWRKEVSEETSAGLAWGWLTGCMSFCSSIVFIGTQKFPKLQVADTVPGQEQLHLGPKKLFQQKEEISSRNCMCFQNKEKRSFKAFSSLVFIVWVLFLNIFSLESLYP